jgi:hypothetical protein
MGRRYTVPIAAVASPAAIFDAWEFLAAANKPVKILRLVIGQTSDTKDSEEEILTLSIIRGHTTSGSGGSTTTPQPGDDVDTAAGLVAETMNTTIASLGSPETTHVIPWNIRVGMDHVFPDGSEPRTHLVIAGDRTVARISAPADAVTISGYAEVEEGQ